MCGGRGERSAVCGCAALKSAFDFATDGDLSVTAGNWLSQHRRQELYWKGNGFATAEIVSSLCGVFTSW